MPTGQINPTPEMLEAAPKYESSEDIKRDYDNGTLKDGDIINYNGQYNHIEESEAIGGTVITPYDERNNKFVSYEGGTLIIDEWIDREKKDKKEKEKTTGAHEVVLDTYRTRESNITSAEKLKLEEEGYKVVIRINKGKFQDVIIANSEEEANKAKEFIDNNMEYKGSEDIFIREYKEKLPTSETEKALRSIAYRQGVDDGDIVDGMSNEDIKVVVEKNYNKLLNENSVEDLTNFASEKIEKEKERKIQEDLEIQEHMENFKSEDAAERLLEKKRKEDEIADKYGKQLDKYESFNIDNESIHIPEEDTEDDDLLIELENQEEKLKTSTLTEEEQDILDNYSIDGTVGEGKAEIKNSEGKTIAYLEGNKLIGKKTIPIIGEQTFEIGEYVKNEDGTYTFKEGKDYDKVMSVASSEDKKVIETFRKAAEDNPKFAEDIINTTEGSETNMSGSDIRTSAITFEPSSEEVVESDTEEVVKSDTEEVVDADKKGFKYIVQIGFWKENVNEETQEKLNKLEEKGYTIEKVHYKGIFYKYIAYKSDSHEDAKKIEEELKYEGFEDSFIYAEKDGKEMEVEEAIDMQYKEKIEIEKQKILDEAAAENDDELMEHYKNNPDNLESDAKSNVDFETVDREDIKFLEENQNHIDEIFAENPDIAEKYEGVPLEEYDTVEGYWDDVYDGIKDKIQIKEEEEKKVNKEETGVFETNKERRKREFDTKRYNDLLNLEEKSALQDKELEELKNEYDGWDLNELHESKKEEQRQRDVNIAAGKGDFTDDELHSQEVEEEVKELEREDNYKITGIRETNAEKEKRSEKEKDENEAKYVDPEIEKIEKIRDDKFLELKNKYYKEDGTTLKDGMNESDYNKEWEEIEGEYYNEYEKISEKGKEHRLTNLQVEDAKAVWSTPDSELKLRNDLKQKLKTQESAIRAAAGDDKRIAELEEQAETTKLALEYLELKNKHGREDDVFDIKTFKEAVENNDVQQLNMWFNDQRTEALGKLEKDRKAIEDGTFEGTEEEREEILTTLETLRESKQKSELPTEYTDEHGVISGSERLTWVDAPPGSGVDKVVSGESRTSRELIYLTNIKSDDKQITQLNSLLKDKDFITNRNKNNLAILANAGIRETDETTESDKVNSGVTTVEPEGGLSGSGMVAIKDWNTGTIYYVSEDWLYAGVTVEMTDLQKKAEKGTITTKEEEKLKKNTVNNKYLYEGFGNPTPGLLTESQVATYTHGHPEGEKVASHYSGGYNNIKQIDQFILNRKQKILATGANPDINLTAEQIALFDEINDPNFDNSLLEQKLDEIVSYSPKAFEYDTEEEQKEIRSMGPAAQNILQGVVNTAKGVLDGFGGPDALVNAVMGKQALAAAMKDVTSEEKAKLSPAFNEHLRQAKELTKRGLHPAEEAKIRKGIDTAYQMGLENSIRGTAGDRAKYLASSGILDAKRSLALLEVAAQDAQLQRENEAKYSELLMYKENFDAAQKESLRTENLQMALANKKAASEFAGLAFSDALGRLGSSSSEIDKLRESLMNGFYKGTGNPFGVVNPFESNPTESNTTETNENTEE